jgi:branched-chain amino acid transport system substrate-binding protein
MTPMSDHTFDREPDGRGLSRSELLRRSALVAAGVPLLAAGRAAAAAPPLPAADLATIRRLIGPIDAASAGRGQTWKIGAILAFSGGGAVYGRNMGEGTRLAVKHIAALGGPRIQVTFQDHASGDQVKGKKAIIALADAHVPAVLSSYGGVGGVILPDVKRRQILAIDPGAGFYPPLDKRPFAWGERSETPYDGLPLVFTYARERLKAKTIAVMFPEVGQFTVLAFKRIGQIAKRYGLEVKATVKPKANATDFSAEIAALRSIGADVILAENYGFDQGYFMKQYKVSGIGKPVFGPEFLAPTVRIAGPAFDGYHFAVDDFNPARPTNPWAQIFVRDYRATFGDGGLPAAVPDFYAAGFYEATFTLWALVRRVLAKKGNIRSGAQLQAALVADPRFPSLFGGTATGLSSIEFDTVGHGLKSRPIALYEVRKGVPVRIGTSDRGGRNLRLTA